ncbi:hypothetical protein [Streptomyces sp. NBRC 109706]|uniref:hypothetical protein n=1 Tax=Streptomyces sp. NBRC 109706 TaxID=1550035 RepID=UPI000AAF961E|nr:hypothetical protein [Streptomyces sp. NBRC 109706]
MPENRIDGSTAETVVQAGEVKGDVKAAPIVGGNNYGVAIGESHGPVHTGTGSIITNNS